MDQTALISAGIGALVGGLISAITSWVIVGREARLGVAAQLRADQLRDVREVAGLLSMLWRRADLALLPHVGDPSNAKKWDDYEIDRQLGSSMVTLPRNLNELASDARNAIKDFTKEQARLFAQHLGPNWSDGLSEEQMKEVAYEAARAVSWREGRIDSGVAALNKVKQFHDAASQWALRRSSDLDGL